MSNVDSSDVNDIPPQVFYEAVIDGDAYAQAQQYRAAAIARWLSDVVEVELSGNLGMARGIRALLVELARRIDAGELRVPKGFR